MLIWFNSPAIKDLVRKVPKQPNEIGCNFIFTERSVDHCCVFDARTRDQIDQEFKAPNPPNQPKTPNCRFWTRNGLRNERFTEVITPNRLAPQDSGTLAVALAIFYLKAKSIEIIGCGWHKNDTASLFDGHYTHNKRFEKGSNTKIQLLRTYQQEFGVPISFVSDAVVDTKFGLVSVEDVLSRNHA